LEPNLTEGIIAEAYEQADARRSGSSSRPWAPTRSEPTSSWSLSDHGFAYDQRGVFERTLTHPPGVLIAAGWPGATPVDRSIQASSTWPPGS